MKIINWIKENYWLTAIMVVAAFLRFYKADYQSIWLDEVLSMIDASPKKTFAQFYESVLIFEAFPHLYFLLLKFFLAIAGYTTLAARIFSAIIGVFGVYGMYCFGKEMYNKNTGLFAAALTSVNIFHLIYSQEIRPYGMFFMFTAFSFYRLLIFLKNPTVRDGIYYGIFTGLIVNSHFFGLLTLFAQFLVVAYHVFERQGEYRRTFFKGSAAAVGVTVLLLIPTIEPLKQIMKIKSFWILPPAPDSFTVMFREFFGNSETVMFIVNLLIIYYCIRVFNRKPERVSAQDPEHDWLIKGFFVLATWLVVSLVIPIVKSYLDVSMILARYFINVVPIFIVATALGISLIKSKAIRFAVVSAVLIFSLVDVFIIKDYYNKPSKCQMRELTNAIKQRYNTNDKLVVFYSWVFPYFFEDAPQIKIEGRSLAEQVKGLRDNTLPKEPFWYANVNPYDLGAEDEKYLLEHFDVRDKLEYYDAWANYYVLKKFSLDKLVPGRLNLAVFNQSGLGEQGEILLSSNTNAITSFMPMENGNYVIKIKAATEQSRTAGGEKAHLKLRINGLVIADYYADVIPGGSEKTFPFVNNSDLARLQLIYDNDSSDRNAVVYSIEIGKK